MYIFLVAFIILCSTYIPLIGVCLIGFIGATIIAITNKNFPLYLFMALFPILPEYFAININDSFPLITGSRILLIYLIFSVFILNNKGRNRVVNSYLISSKTYIFLLLFLVFEILAFLPHFQSIDSVKDIFSIILERVVLFMCLIKAIDNKKLLSNCLRILVISSGFVFVFGIIESFTRVNLAYFLNTAGRANMLMASFGRLGIIRSEFSFGHPIAFAMYIIVMLPLIMYWIDLNSNKFRYMFIFLVGIICLCLTISRGTIIVFILLFPFLITSRNKKDRYKYYVAIVLGLLISFCGSLINTGIYTIMKNIILSCLNALGTKFSLDNFGNNTDAVYSRMSQLTMIPQVFNVYPLCGGGSGYILSHDVYVYAVSGTFKAKSIDIDYLRLLLENGLFGLVGTLGWYYHMLHLSFINFKNKRKENINKTFFFIFLSYYLGLLTVCELTTPRIIWVLYAMFIAHNALSLSETNNI